MLPSNRVIFTAVEAALLDSVSASSWSAASEALDEIARRRIPLVLVTSATRAELGPLREKMEHGHPFITESGGGIFLADGYFSQRLEGAVRVARYFCVPFGRPYAEATAAAEEIAEETGATIVGYSQMTARELARNTGQSVRQAELARQREFSERFFFAGDADAVTSDFERKARAGKWDVIRGDPFWELHSGNDEARALRHLMGLYRASLHTRLHAIAIGSSARDLPLLGAADHAIVLPRRGQEVDPVLALKLPKAIHGDAPGPKGWNQAVLTMLEDW